MGQKWRKWTNMGNQHDLDFLTWVSHTTVSIWQNRSITYMDRPHARAYVTALNMGVLHERVSVEPKFSSIRKRPLLRAFRHSKAYLNT
ncbi:hypothetical protein F383_13591 [Gossypium arboreum]|uniref:Uncharacterized protein n=1 Tax=Gossypium arboreum TaxID=29729 RepID=A0A0B0Q0W3_GOSAR|nr:hypothetical protein F383_13591 [Gossypium arboreum]